MSVIVMVGEAGDYFIVKGVYQESNYVHGCAGKDFSPFEQHV